MPLNAHYVQDDDDVVALGENVTLDDANFTQSVSSIEPNQTTPADEYFQYEISSSLSYLFR